MTNNPDHILLFCGKRKSGKDYITDNLQKRLGSEKSIIIKLSGPIKSHWAKSFNLDMNQLLSDGEYKEKYRLEMIKWGEDKRREDNGYFCKAAIEMYNAPSKKIWIISDVRRKTDIKWFKEVYGELCKTIRIKCNDDIRSQRGWKFTPGIDDCETECDLDDVNDWDLEIINERGDLDDIIANIIRIIN
ncbi:phosphomevalonate kinase [Microplitis mediator]|uniref:phosphomevalonate kinase n=1 Tax=Microplitis mediator TaxID=375433 RepID=UPI0025565575|nr:phosphomevalonate kinase [Microplitis mediator]